MEIEGMGHLLDAVALKFYGLRAQPHFHKPLVVRGSVRKNSASLKH